MFFVMIISNNWTAFFLLFFSQFWLWDILNPLFWTISSMCMLACVITKWECPLECHEEILVCHGACESLLVWWHEHCPILLTGTCLDVRGHPVRSNPHSNLTRLRDSGNQTCNGRPSCSPNTSTNQILIEFQRTCKNLVQFCYSIFLTDVPVIPVKWSVVVTSSVWKHIHELADLDGRK